MLAKYMKLRSAGCTVNACFFVWTVRNLIKVYDMMLKLLVLRQSTTGAGPKPSSSFVLQGLTLLLLNHTVLAVSLKIQSQ